MSLIFPDPRRKLTVHSNVHGVYAPGNVRLHPELLGKHQAYVSEKLGGSDKKPGSLSRTESPSLANSRQFSSSSMAALAPARRSTARPSACVP